MTVLATSCRQLLRRPPPQGPLPQGQPSLLPGLTLLGLVAAIATLLAEVLASAGIVVSPLLVSLLLGLTIAQLRPTPASLLPGLAFGCRPLLRFAIVLLGLRIGLPQATSLGLHGLAAVALIVGSTIAGGYCISRRLGLSPNLAWLLASGHAICGAAAVAAADAVLEAEEREVSQALTLVTLFGTVVMLLFPVLGSVFDLSPTTYGFWVGGSVHEVAQAVAAGFAHGDASGEVASLVKMVRVAFLLPLGLLLSAVVARRQIAGRRRRLVVPWFVVGCAALAGLDAMQLVPAVVVPPLQLICTVAMTCAMAALGLKSSLRDVAQAGARPLLAAAATTTGIGVLALGLASRF